MRWCAHSGRLLALLLFLVIRPPEGRAAAASPGAGSDLAADADTLRSGPAAAGDTLRSAPAAMADTLRPAPAAAGDTLRSAPAAMADTLRSGPAAIADTLRRSPAAARRPGKNPTGAMLRSLAVPGWGQWYNGKRFKAVVAAGVEIGLVADAIVQNQLAAASADFYDREFYRNNRSLAIWWLGAAILYSMADAYVDAHLFDFDDSLELTLGPDLAPEALPAGLAMTFRLTLHL